jgi:hypothetical protein
LAGSFGESCPERRQDRTEHGDMTLHFQRFSRRVKTAVWIRAYQRNFPKVAIYDLRRQAEQCSSVVSFSPFSTATAWNSLADFPRQSLKDNYATHFKIRQRYRSNDF